MGWNWWQPHSSRHTTTAFLGILNSSQLPARAYVRAGTRNQFQSSFDIHYSDTSLLHAEFLRVVVRICHATTASDIPRNFFLRCHKGKRATYSYGGNSNATEGRLLRTKQSQTPFLNGFYSGSMFDFGILNCALLPAWATQLYSFPGINFTCIHKKRPASRLQVKVSISGRVYSLNLHCSESLFLNLQLS